MATRGAARAVNLPSWARSSADGRGLVLTVHVRPGARSSGPAGRHGDALGVRIAAPASENRANEALIDFLQCELALPRTAVRIARGARSRHKVVEIDACGEALARRLCAWDEEKTRT
jgi:uncharacterized protein (TIGR00251 family)